MKLTNLYYKAFKELRETTKQNSESKKARKKLNQSNNKIDSLTSTQYSCVIEFDWIDMIDKNLVFIEKAIREDRQFIRTEGNVVPIEKVKKTSKDSIEHLSKHSDFITHIPKEEGEPLIPDKLYVVEKLSDYLVYENRFLYMLLLYLKDFIGLRITKIKDKVTTYDIEMNMQKIINDDSRNMLYEVNYKDNLKNDPVLVNAYKMIPHAQKMEEIYEQVLGLLSTELMKQVAKAPVIKPPVVKTNVLRMNQNFKSALALYEYITSYTKDGYELKEIKNVTSPFSIELSDELSETVLLTSMINYNFTHNLEEELNLSYQKDKLKKEQLEKEKLLETIKKLKKKLSESNQDPLEYIARLEELNKIQEKEIASLLIDKEKTLEYIDEITQLTETIKQQDEEKKQLVEKMNDKENEIHELKLIHLDEIAEIKELNISEINRLKEEHTIELEKIETNQQERINLMTETHQNKLNELSQMYLETDQKQREKITQIELDNKQMHTDINQKEEEFMTLLETKRQINARYNGLREKYGLIEISEEFTSKKDFKELESEMDAFKKFFNVQWKKTKTKIKTNVKEEMNKKN